MRNVEGYGNYDPPLERITPLIDRSLVPKRSEGAPTGPVTAPPTPLNSNRLQTYHNTTPADSKIHAKKAATERVAAKATKPRECRPIAVPQGRKAGPPRRRQSSDREGRRRRPRAGLRRGHAGPETRRRAPPRRPLLLLSPDAMASLAIAVAILICLAAGILVLSAKFSGLAFGFPSLVAAPEINVRSSKLTFAPDKQKGARRSERPLEMLHQCGLTSSQSTSWLCRPTRRQPCRN